MKTVVNTEEYGTECWTCNFQGYNSETSLFSAEYDLHRTLCADEKKLGPNDVYEAIQKEGYENEENCRQNAANLQKTLEEVENGANESETCCHQPDGSSESGFKIKDGKPVTTCSHLGCPKSEFKGLNTKSCKALLDWALNQEQDVKVEKTYNSSNNKKTDKNSEAKSEVAESESENSVDLSEVAESESENSLSDYSEYDDSESTDCVSESESPKPLTETSIDNQITKLEHEIEHLSVRRSSVECKLKTIENKRLNFLKDKSFSSSNMLAKLEAPPKKQEKVKVERAAQITEVRPKSHHFLW